LENAFAHEPAGVAETIRLALDSGLAGASIEDYTGDGDAPIYEPVLAAERVAAACEVAHGGPVHLVVTARTEIYLRGRPDVDEAVTRLQSFREAGADVVFVPGMANLDEIKRTVDEVGLPVSVLVSLAGMTVQELAGVGVARISVGGGFAFAAYAGLVEAATELRDSGTVKWREKTAAGAKAARAAFA
jgi:2-methylisocitrate lyase-like PEP mutase family enzyme